MGAGVSGLCFRTIRTVDGLARILRITPFALALSLRLALNPALALPMSIRATACAMCPSARAQRESCNTYHHELHLIASTHKVRMCRAACN